jgi:hypothetical protein
MQCLFHRNVFQVYAISLSKQIHERNLDNIGKSLGTADIETFSGDQIAQLYQLYEEINK